MPQHGNVCAKVIRKFILILPANPVIILVDGEARGSGTASRKYVAKNIAANIALASLRKEDP
jgi:hypothetical protein